MNGSNFEDDCEGDDDEKVECWHGSWNRGWKCVSYWWGGESTLRVSHFSPNKVMYNEYYSM